MDDQSCNARARRRLAANPSVGDQAKQWRLMARCVVGQLMHTESHLFLHISKSGGTSMCKLLKDEGCYTGTSNCHTPELDTTPSWVRSEAVNHFGLPRWMGYRQSAQYPEKCESIYKFLRGNTDTRLISLEQYLPDMKACGNSFLTSVIIRDPVDRLNSHYKEIMWNCGSNCTTVLQSRINGLNLFNVTTLAYWFDIVTDNYLVRSLGGSDSYGAPFQSIGNNKTLLDKALNALRDINWVMILQQNKKMEDPGNTIILKRGLGLTNGLPHQRSSSDHNPHLTYKDSKWLRELNQPDYIIWEEAQRLHSLDVISLQNFELFASDIFLEYHNMVVDISSQNCCGNICGSFSSKDRKI